MFSNPISNQDYFARCCIRRFCRTPSKQVMESIRDLTNKRSVSDLDPKLKQRVLHPLRSDSRQGILGMTRGPAEELIFCLEMDNTFFLFTSSFFFLFEHCFFFPVLMVIEFFLRPDLGFKRRMGTVTSFFWLSHYVKREARAGRIGFPVNSGCP